MKRKRMRVKHLRGWVDKRRTASQRKSVEGVRFCIVFRVRHMKICGGLAQLGERLPCKQEVSGSIPLISTTYGSLAQLVRAHA